MRGKEPAALQIHLGSYATQQIPSVPLEYIQLNALRASSFSRHSMPRSANDYFIKKFYSLHTPGYRCTR